MVFFSCREYSPILTRPRIVEFLFLSNFPYVGLIWSKWSKWSNLRVLGRGIWSQLV